jgi:hypothetical protein
LAYKNYLLHSEGKRGRQKLILKESLLLCCDLREREGDLDLDRDEEEDDYERDRLLLFESFLLLRYSDPENDEF